MRIFSRSQKIKSGKITLPVHYRAVLGWHEGTELYISSLKTNDQSNYILNELVITPISPKDRLDLWRLQISFIDTPGLLKKLTNILVDFSIDILTCRVVTTEQSGHIHVDMMLDMQLYRSPYDKDTLTRQKNKYVYLDELKNIIVSKFIDNILFISGAESLPAAKIKRNLSVYQSYEFLDKHGRDSLNSGSIRIPETMIRKIKDRYIKTFPEVKTLSPRDNQPIISLVANFEAACIRAFVYFKNTHMLHIRIDSKDKVGAIARTCSLLFELGFNIQQMYNRKLPDSLWSRSDYLIYFIIKNNAQLHTDAELKNRINKKFTKIKTEYHFKVKFPKLKTYRYGKSSR